MIRTRGGRHHASFDAGLSVAEVVIAIALLSITCVSLLAVLAGGLRTDRKAYFKDAAASTARTLLTRTLSKVSRDDPVGAKANFWNTDRPKGSPQSYLSGTEEAGDVTFHYDIYTQTITAANGTVFGTPDHRLKQVDVYVRWGGDDSRVGYGSTSYHDRRIISEASGDNF